MYYNYNIENLLTFLKIKEVEKELFPQQYDCAKEIVSNYLFGKRYGFLKAKTQSGKTGVFCAVVNILNFYATIKKSLNVDIIYYITGDNQDIKPQAEKDYLMSCIQTLFKYNITVKFLKNSDMKKVFYTLKNCLIVIDESHYGTMKPTNIVNKFLKKGGINYMKNDDNMEKNNAYILSVSATPWKELANDKFHTKFIAELETTEDYKGFEEFNENKQIYTLYDKSILKDDTLCYNFFTDEVYNYLKELEEKTKRKHYVIVRNLGNFELTKENTGNKYHIITVKGKNNQKVDYTEMYDAIEDICIEKEEYPNKYLLIEIKGTFRMGKRFKNKAKDYCGVCVDYSDNIKNVETTEQGLLGRFSGYVNGKKRIKDAWKNIRFYMSKIHYDMIKQYIDRSDYLTPYDYENEEGGKHFRRIRKVWGAGDLYGVNSELLSLNEPLEFNVTEYFKDKQDLLDNLLNYEVKLKRGGLYNLVQDIIKSVDEIPNKYFSYINCGCRRVPSKNSKFAEINYADGGANWEGLRNPNNYLKNVKKTTLILSDKNNIILKIQESIIDKYTPVDKLVNGVKEIETYTTTEPTFDFDLTLNKEKIEVVA